MYITEIRESGASNILMWALANGANINGDNQLIQLINDELFYLVTLTNVNQFELFRLTQMYRDKLKVKTEHQASMPLEPELKARFPGDYTPESGDPIANAKLAEAAIQNFVNLTQQMMVDDDIIYPGAIRLFLPMITRMYDVQIPVAFADIVQSMDDDEAIEIFTKEYPATLNKIIENQEHGVARNLLMAFIQGTGIIKYDDRYDKYLQILKYAPLKSYKGNNNLYRMGLLGFSKRDMVNAGEVKCSLYKPNASTVPNTFKQLQQLRTPLEVEVVVQIPIQYMQMIENSFGGDILTITYESSIGNILDGGLQYNDFMMLPNIPADTEEPSEIDKLTAHNVQIEAYRVRLAEAHQVLLNTFPVFLQSNDDVDVRSTFAMLPSLSMTTGVFNVSADHIDKFITHDDPTIKALFTEIKAIMETVNSDLRKSKEK